VTLARGESVSPYAKHHSHVESKKNALSKRAERFGSLAYCYVSDKVRDKLGTRAIAAVRLCHAQGDGFKGCWFMALGGPLKKIATLFLCSVYTIVPAEMPFRDPRAWILLGLDMNDYNASFPVQNFAGLMPGYTAGVPKVLSLNSAPHIPASEQFELTVAAEREYAPGEEEKLLAQGAPHRDKFTGRRIRDVLSKTPLLETRPDKVQVKGEFPSISMKPKKTVRFAIDTAADDPAGGGEAADFEADCVDSAGSERKHEEPETQVEPDSYEVSRIYAPKGSGKHRGESNLSAERDGKPLDWRTDLDAASSVTIDDLKLVVQVSWEGWGNDRQWIQHDQLAEGTLKDKWDLNYGKVIAKAKQELLKRIKAHAKRQRKQNELAKVAFLSLPEVARKAHANWGPNLTDGDPGQRLDLESWVVEQARSAKQTRKRKTNAWWSDSPQNRVVGTPEWIANLPGSDSYAEGSDPKFGFGWGDEETAKIARDCDESDPIDRVGREGPPAPTIETPPRDTPMPKTLEQAFISKYGPQWKEAFAKEIAGLQARHTYETVKLTQDMFPLLTLKPVFKIKFLTDGALDKFKIRLVVGGHRAIKGVHFNETFSPVMSIPILRMVLAIFAAHPEVETHVWDVEQAYLWSDLNERVYCRAPTGFAVPEGHVLRLKKAIYGLPQAGREFWKLLRSILKEQGFEQSEHAPCFFWKRCERGFIIVMTYVDDLTVTTNSKAMREELFADISARLKLEDRGVISSFLGMDFKYNATELHWTITQEVFILDLLRSMNLDPEVSRPAATPEVKRSWYKAMCAPKDDDERLRVAEFDVRSKIGSLMWLLVCCRPDLMHAVKIQSQFVSDPGMENVKAIMRIGRYLVGSAAEGLRLQGVQGEVAIGGVTDSDDAGSEEHRRSILTFCYYVGHARGPRAFVVWECKWSYSVTSGSFHSEICGIDLAFKGGMVIRGVLGEINLLPSGPTPMQSDSQSSITSLQGQYREKATAGVKHIDRRVMRCGQLTAGPDPIFQLEHVSSEENVADIGSAYKSIADFKRLRTMIMGYEFPEPARPCIKDSEEPQRRGSGAAAAQPAEQAADSARERGSKREGRWGRRERGGRGAPPPRRGRGGRGARGSPQPLLVPNDDSTKTGTSSAAGNRD
jgi:hypothetical protein